MARTGSHTASSAGMAINLRPVPESPVISWRGRMS
jgi:hypothetical protein